jgi:RimJ/RimL family protein N-acetyltransferase
MAGCSAEREADPARTASERENDPMSARDAWSSREVPTLRGEHVLLRRLIPADIEDRRVLGRNAEENRMYGGSLRADEPMTLEQAEAWYARGAEKPDQTRWAIEFERHCIGSCTLTGTGGLRRFAIGISAPRCGTKASEARQRG